MIEAVTQLTLDNFGHKIRNQRPWLDDTTKPEVRFSDFFARFSDFFVRFSNFFARFSDFFARFSNFFARFSDFFADSRPFFYFASFLDF